MSIASPARPFVALKSTNRLSGVTGTPVRTRAMPPPTSSTRLPPRYTVICAPWKSLPAASVSSSSVTMRSSSAASMPAAPGSTSGSSRQTFIASSARAAAYYQRALWGMRHATGAGEFADRVRVTHVESISGGREGASMSIGTRSAAEFFGTFWLVLGGCGAAVISAGFPQLGIGFLGVALAFGLTVVTGAYALGHISGAHFNPAITFGLAASRRFPGSEVLPYIAAQVGGGILAAMVLYLIASG